MTAALLAASTAGLIVWTAALGRQDRQRLASLRRDLSAASTATSPLARAGRPVLGLFRRSDLMARHFNDGDCKDLGVALLVGLAVTAYAPSFGLAITAVLVVRPVMARRRAVVRRHQQIEDELPLMTELLRIGVDSGLNVTMALQAVAARVDGPLSDELRHALREVDRGRRIADALDDVSLRAGDATRPLIGGLVAAERYGAPLSAVLERLALESRADQSRRAERAAKRLTVFLLFPLAGCTLPAFALLTVAPLLAGSIGSLAFFS